MPKRSESSAASTEPRCPGCGRPVSECQADDVDESPAAYLRCGFCQRPWEECKAHSCPERRIVLLAAKGMGYALSPDEESEVARGR